MQVDRIKPLEADVGLVATAWADGRNGGFIDQLRRAASTRIRNQDRVLVHRLQSAGEPHSIDQETRQRRAVVDQFFKKAVLQRLRSLFARSFGVACHYPIP